MLNLHWTVAHPVDHHLDVVLGHAGLAVDIDGFFLERMFVGNAINEGNQQVKARVQCLGVFAEALDHIGITLRHDLRRLGDCDDDQSQKGQ